MYLRALKKNLYEVLIEKVRIKRKLTLIWNSFIGLRVIYKL